MNHSRTAQYPIDPMFLARWSPRAYAGIGIPEPELLTMMEAARWAPSAYNNQPWRFLYSRRNDAHWGIYVGFLDDGNAQWAHRASALIVVLSDSLTPKRAGRPRSPSSTHSFDTGAAWAQLGLQATLMGYQAHAMAGIDYEAVRERLAVPDEFRIEIAIAIGRKTDAEVLSDELRSREKPSQRLPLWQISHAGLFPESAAAPRVAE